MPLMEHLRELRRRVFWSVLALVPGVTLGWIFYDQLFAWLSAPICDVQVRATSVAAAAGRWSSTACWARSTCRSRSPWWPGSSWPARSGCTSCGRSSPRGCTATSAAGRSASWSPAIPLFFAGAGVCYWILPRATTLLLGFTPDQVGSIVGLQRLPVVRDADVAGLRPGLRGPGVHRAAQPGRHPAGRKLRRLVAPDRLRRLPVRRGRHPDRRPVHDDRPRRCRCAC